MTTPVRVAVTGAAGQIGYALLFRIASGAMLGPGSLHTTVTLQRATSAGGPFVNAQTTTSAEDGTFTFSGLTPSRTTWFRAIGGGGTSPAARVVVDTPEFELVRVGTLRTGIIAFRVLRDLVPAFLDWHRTTALPWR